MPVATRKKGSLTTWAGGRVVLVALVALAASVAVAPTVVLGRRVLGRVVLVGLGISTRSNRTPPSSAPSVSLPPGPISCGLESSPCSLSSFHKGAGLVADPPSCTTHPR